jgi:hypothetical protein
MKRPPWPLRIIYFVVALCLAFWLIATLVWFEFGRNAEEQMVDLALDVITLVGIVCERFWTLPFSFRYLWSV